MKLLAEKAAEDYFGDRIRAVVGAMEYQLTPVEVQAVDEFIADIDQVIQSLTDLPISTGTSPINPHAKVMTEVDTKRNQLMLRLGEARRKLAREMEIDQFLPVIRTRE